MYFILSNVHCGVFVCCFCMLPYLCKLEILDYLELDLHMVIGLTSDCEQPNVMATNDHLVPCTSVCILNHWDTSLTLKNYF